MQEAGSRHDILIFGGARETGVLGMMKRQAIADAETIVDRQHDETMRRQILIHGVAVAVVIHVTPTEQHLPRRPPVQKYHTRFSIAGFPGTPVEQLTVHQGSVSRLERDLLGRNELREREFRVRSRGQRRAVRPVEI